jgi:hypothetical protein
MSLGDPDYVNVTKVIDDLVTGDLIRTLREMTSEEKVLDSIDQYGGPDYGVTSSNVPEDHGTSHISVLDKDGNAVALTSTINTYFGSMIISPSTGIPPLPLLCDLPSSQASSSTMKWMTSLPQILPITSGLLPSRPTISRSPSLGLCFCPHDPAARKKASLLDVSHAPCPEI